MKFASHFAPNESIVQDLLAEVSDLANDASHDISHILRVWNSVQLVSAKEGGGTAVLTAAALLQ